MNLIQERLNKYKEKILDLSLRNQLLKTNFNRQKLRVIDELPDSLYSTLALAGKKMYFKALKNLPDTPLDENTSAFREKLEMMKASDEEYLIELEKIQNDQTIDDINQANEDALRKLKDQIRKDLNLPKRKYQLTDLREHAIQQGLTPDYQLPKSQGGDQETKHTDRAIQTLLLNESLGIELRRLDRLQKSSQKESGINPLFMCFGYIEWRASDDSNQPLNAPLLLLQIEFAEDVTKSKNEKKLDSKEIQHCGDPVEVNTTLDEKLKRDFGYSLPEISEEDINSDIFSIEQYWEQVEKEITRFPKWKLKRFVTVGHYSSQNIPIYKDLQAITTTEVSDLIIKMLDGRKDSSSTAITDDCDVDQVEVDKNIPSLIESADSSQYAAVVDVLDGENIVIKGPPGTGKSQTITNIIASLMHQGKRVLFVAQKQAALDVVKNNLSKNGLEDFILEVFSVKANKRDVFESIEKRVNKKPPLYPEAYDSIFERYKEIKAELNNYRDIISTKYGETGKTIHEMVWDKSVLDEQMAIPVELLNFEFGDPAQLTEYELSIFMKSLKELAGFELLDSDNSLKYNPLKYVTRIIHNPYDVSSAEEKIKTLALSMEELAVNQKDFYSEYLDESKSSEFFLHQHTPEFSTSVKKIQEASLRDPQSLMLLLTPKAWKQVLKLVVLVKGVSFLEQSNGSFLHIDQKMNDDRNYYLGESEAHDPRWLKLTERSLRYTAKNNEYEKNTKELEQEFDVYQTIYNTDELKESIKLLRATWMLSWLSSDWRRAKSLYMALAKEPCVDPKNMGVRLKNLTEYIESSQSTKDVLNLESKLLGDMYVEIRDSISLEIASHKKDVSRLKQELKELFSDSIDYSSIFDVIAESEFNELILHSGELPEDFLDQWKKHPDMGAKWLFLEEKEGQLSKDAITSLEPFGIELKCVTGFTGCPDQSDVSISSFRPCVDEMLQFYREFESQFPRVRSFMEYLALKKSLEKTNPLVGDFYELYKSTSLPISDAPDVFRSVVKRQQLQDLYEKYGEKLSEYGGVKLSNLKKELVSLDSELRSNTRLGLASKIWSNSSYNEAPRGRESGRVAEKTERGLINHIVNKPSTRISLRHLFEKSSETLAHIKPCTLMSPLSVSQMLPLAVLFDVVVIDEASQMKPELSIPSIARAKQTVIVGDPNQLPPLNFGGKKADENEEEDFADESILDMALTVLPNPRELLWHYRSRHEDLIRFSNIEFYGGKLMIPVTANPEETGRGITYNFLENGIYTARGGENNKGGINEIEAGRMVDGIIHFMKKRPEESLGVVLMNSTQRDLVQNLFDMKSQKSLDALTYLSFWQSKSGGIHEFFIKNLESVQGDERDVIMIGTVYGPNKNGEVHQRFYISGLYGWRRLNVLITRAKHEVILFTSLPPHKIQNTTSKSMEAFKKYLEFADTKKLTEGTVTNYPVDNPFQQWAIDQVNSLPGFSAEWEIGVAGFRIDIGVRHEEFAGWIMGIETDGATYHSTRSARDRDILRQEILEGHQWRFHRIWSTDYMRDPRATREKLQNALESRLDEMRNIRSSQPALSDVTPINPKVFQSVAIDGRQPYILADVCDAITPNANDFYKSSYRYTLTKAIEHVIAIEGPIEIGLLVRRIRLAHGFRKAGKEIHLAIKKAIPKKLITTSLQGKIYYWPEGVDPEVFNKARYFQSEDDRRTYDELCPEEMAAIVALGQDWAQEKNSILKSEDTAKTISLFLGWKKCSSAATIFIWDALGCAKNIDYFSKHS